jgi:hypothetical protein
MKACFAQMAECVIDGIRLRISGLNVDGPRLKADQNRYIQPSANSQMKRSRSCCLLILSIPALALEHDEKNAATTLSIADSSALVILSPQALWQPARELLS